jgi:hypothetical protein
MQHVAAYLSSMLHIKQQPVIFKTMANHLQHGIFIAPHGCKHCRVVVGAATNPCPKNLFSIHYLCCANPCNCLSGHGTQVAGIIAARNNGARYVGVSPGARLFSLKVFNGNASGTWSSVYKAIEWVITEGRQQYNIRLVNLSSEMLPLGNVDQNEPGYNEVYAMACGLMARADAAGVLLVVSAGNNGASLRT